MAMVIRAAAGGGTVLPALRDALRRVDPDLPATRVGTLSALVSQATGRDRFYAIVLAVFAVTALLLASLGLYGVMASLVSSGSADRDSRGGGWGPAITWLVVREGLGIAAVGLLVGAAGAAASARVLGSLLYGIRPCDPLTYAGMSAVILGVTLLASWAPLRRAVRVDPIDALRA
jgi:hypothetical protein